MKDDTNSLKGKKILLVEDDLFFSKIIESKLYHTGCDFVHAKDGETSFILLEKEVPDVIILDILLPGGIDGFGVLEKIKADEKLKHIPVVILSNLGQVSDVEKGMSLGAFRYIVKASIIPDEIIPHLVSAINSTVK